MLYSLLSIMLFCIVLCLILLYVLSLFILVCGCRSGKYVWEDHRPRSGVWKGTNGGEAISFSGCDDDQTSADTSVKSYFNYISHHAFF